jgi:hypothetical protein
MIPPSYSSKKAPKSMGGSDWLTVTTQIVDFWIYMIDNVDLKKPLTVHNNSCWRRRTTGTHT